MAWLPEVGVSVLRMISVEDRHGLWVVATSIGIGTVADIPYCRKVAAWPGISL